MLDHEITLIATTDSFDADGYNTPTETSRTVFADAEMPTRAEFYAALQSGVKIGVTFKVVTDDYNNEPFAEWDGKRFSIERTYPVNRVYSRLICTEVV